MKLHELKDIADKQRKNPVIDLIINKEGTELVYPEEEAEREDSYVNDDDDGSLDMAIMILTEIGNWMDKVVSEGKFGYWLDDDDVEDVEQMANTIFRFLQDQAQELTRDQPAADTQDDQLI